MNIKDKKTKRKISKKILRKIDRIHQTYDGIFKDDEILLAKLKREVNVRQQKAS